MNRRTMLIGGVAVAALVALLAWAFAPRPVEVEVAEATMGPFETTVDEDARTRVADRYVVSAPLAARLQRVSLREGDAVAAGDLLATLLPAFSPMLDERSLLEQQARVATAQAGVQLASTRIGAARVALEQARAEQRRTEQLAQQGFVSPSKIEGDRLATAAAQKALEVATEGERIARHELAQARAALSAVRDGSSARGAFELRSPVAGRVLKVHHQSETVVATGTPLLELGDTARMEIVAELLTTDALLAVPGSAVRIERWGGPDVLQGRVRLVEPAAFTKISALGVEEQRVNVLIDLTSPAAAWAALGDGYRVGVRIVTRSEASVLRVPVSAVFPLPADGGGATGPAVFVLDGGRARLQPVQLGARNGSEAWIQHGLTPGAKVLIYPPAAVQDGAKVRVRSV
ncbi:MAG: HlyD family efflux transporter periplasmic adaptor subunit [Betaproteobacteria bacterium]|nr:HlyD family efflux transporter periplasmic adaptor subunit [Betaproteobacteria bacterium]